MNKALEQAKIDYQKDEVPIGAIITYKEKIIAQAHNQVEEQQNPCAHAEALAIQKASQYLNDWRLDQCSIYSTKEPCLMCLGALINSRIKNIFIGLSDKKFGALQFLKNNKIFHHQFQITLGILEEESLQLIQSFFQKKRTLHKIQNNDNLEYE